MPSTYPPKTKLSADLIGAGDLTAAVLPTASELALSRAITAAVNRPTVKLVGGIPEQRWPFDESPAQLHTVAALGGNTTKSKTPVLYIGILGVWGVLIAAVSFTFMNTLMRALAHRAGPIVVTFLVLNALFIGYFWLNGVKDIIYVAYYYRNKKKLVNTLDTIPRRGNADTPKVLLLYCTANDFSEDSLERSIRQNYRNTKLVILDDSTDPAMMSRVDVFAALHEGEVIRRQGRVGYKAGNLNNYLAGRTDYEFFVLLDSDEIVPPNFIDRGLDYFAAAPDTGIVQANHKATRNRTPFMDLFAPGVDSHWPTYQATKNHAGFMSLLGHGALISRGCYEKAGGFPHVVAEDLCFSIEARAVHLYVVFADDIVCEEEYPIDYLAFKKRHSKWTQGNLEFIKTYTGTIFRSKMRWFEKIDIVLFTYNLPLTAVFAFYIVINLIAFPLLGFTPNYPAWLLIPTVIFLVGPTLNDIVHHSKLMTRPALLKYLVHTFALYGSMFFVSLYASLRGILGAKAVFLVTPKESESVSFWSAVGHNRRELIFATTLLTISAWTTHSPLPVLMIVIPSILSVHLTLMTSEKKPRTANIVSWDALMSERNPSWSAATDPTNGNNWKHIGDGRGQHRSPARTARTVGR